MSTATVTRRPASGTLAEVVDIILDKGLVIDAYVRISVVGIELVTIDIRVVVASVDTYLHFAEATNRLDLRSKAEEGETSLQELLSGFRKKDEGPAAELEEGEDDEGADAQEVKQAARRRDA